MQDIAHSLRGLEFFHDIDDSHLQRVAAIGSKVLFPALHDIFREHEPSKDVYFIIKGRVSLVVCAPRLGCRQLMEVGSGELIGWSALVGRSRLSDTARTLTPTEAIAVPGDRLLALCAEDPQFGFEFMHRAAQTLASRISATRLLLLDMAGGRLPQIQMESD